MRKSTVAGVVMLGAVSAGVANAQSFYSLAPYLTPQEKSKVWSVAGSVRGFYDDNYLTVPDGPGKRESFGIEIQPSVSLNMTGESTYIGARVDYSYQWFEDDRDPDYQQGVLANITVAHSFSEQFKVTLEDSFRWSQEPDLTSGATAVPIRTDGNNLSNRASVDATYIFSDLLQLGGGYAFSYYNFDDAGGPGSRSGLLDRNEHQITASLGYVMSTETTFSVGYIYNLADYTSSDGIAPGVPSSIRDSMSHIGYVGWDQRFANQFRLNIRAGIQSTTYDNTVPEQDATNPYLDASVSYQYNPASVVTVGARHTRAATDVVGAVPGTPTLDQEVTTLYVDLRHAITSSITLGAVGTAQFGEYESGSLNSVTEDLYSVSLSVAYRFNPFIAVEAGYSYSVLESDNPVPRDYDRNRTYIGVRGIF
ncbi:MAG: outer membrane beta-barrel protein [Verrucomicrobiae bacterium]|nr:outer membrane beta-barrel protein [Verrucomicrobiae bacterium]